MGKQRAVASAVRSGRSGSIDVRGHQQRRHARLRPARSAELRRHHQLLRSRRRALLPGATVRARGLMRTTRLEAFSDGVIAILITIMVLELRVPEGADWPALRTIGPTLSAYVMSFVYLGIYWNNHHHLFHTVDRVTGGMLWANLHLLFWLSLVPFVTHWMGENGHAALPTAMYGVVLLCAAISYTILVRVIIHAQGPHSKLKAA